MIPLQELLVGLFFIQMVFKYNDKFYQSTYSIASTEQQDERPYEYDDEIECSEVEPIDISVRQWIRIEE